MIKIISLICLLLCSQAQAFVFITGGAYSAGERPVSKALMWTNRTLTFHINTDQNAYSGSIGPELSSAEFISAVTSAASAWNSVCGSNISVVIGSTTTNTKNSGDSTNVVIWDNRTTAGGNSIASTGTLAAAFSNPNNTTNVQADCDIVVNGEATGTFAIDGSAGNYDLVGVLVHEMGHCLGLDHTVSSTYTSTNSILTNAVMKSAVGTADLTMRALSQDEVDAMECVNPSTAGYSDRGGYFCTSYHGTSGNGALSGVVSGGPSYTRSCGDGASAAITKSSSSGGGCVSKAIASEGTTNEKEPLELGWTFLWAMAIGVFFLFKKAKKIFLAGALLFILPTNGFSALEFSYGITQANPSLAKNAALITTNEGTYTTTTYDPENNFKYFKDIQVAISYYDSTNSTWAFYYKLNNESQVVAKGVSSANVVQMTKTTSLEGWTAGIARRYYYYSSAANEPHQMNYFFELQLGAGPSTFNQSIVDTTTTTHKIEASAIAIETNAFLGATYPLLSSLDMLLKIGYSRFHTNYFKVSSVSGTRYGSLASGDRLALKSNEDFRLVRDGASAHLGLVMNF